MTDVTDNGTASRTAIAPTIAQMNAPGTIFAKQNKKIPNGDVHSMSKAADLLGVNKMADSLPNCHHLPIGYADFPYDTYRLEMTVLRTAKTMFRTGVEVEAMQREGLAPLSMYEMLKSIDKDIDISSIKFQEKKGSKSDFSDEFINDPKTVLIVCSDSSSAGKKEDTEGKVIIKKLEPCGVSITKYLIVPDEVETIRGKIDKPFLKNDLINSAGGTGLFAKDSTPEAIRPLVATPGSNKGAKETMDALFPSAFHIFKRIKGSRHN